MLLNYECLNDRGYAFLLIFILIPFQPKYFTVLELDYLLSNNGNKHNQYTDVSNGKWME